MTNIDQDGYAVLRFGGASQARACAELGVSFGRGPALEAQFRSATRPRFARHDVHVTAVLAAGGYSAIRP